MNTLRSLVTLLALATGTSAMTLAGSAPLIWQTNLDEALADARSRARPVLMFFSGSDWDVWSQKMERQIFDTADFASFAAERLILLKLEFPKSYVLPEAQLKQNRSLQKKYGISGYPAVVVTDDTGAVIGRLSYTEDGPQHFLGELSRLIE